MADRLRAARGVFFGTLFGVAFWMALGLTLWLAC